MQREHKMNTKALDAIFQVAVSNAIRSMGVVAFKQTSLFGSNESQVKQLKKAA